MAQLCTLFSGSSGNSTYVGSSGSGILIDIGRSAKQIENALYKNEIEISSIHAIFITHEHTDHVKGLKVFASKHSIKVYASSGTIEALEDKNLLSNKIEYESINDNGNTIGDIMVKSFHTSHDSAESLGYIIKTPDDRTASIATDLGFVSEDIRKTLSNSDIVLIESNHDIRMLENGSYPYFLKQRILSNIGHLSNEACSNELPNLIKKGVARFILAHLSGENNIPELAYQTAICSLSAYGMVSGKDFELFVAPKENLGLKKIIF